MTTTKQKVLVGIKTRGKVKTARELELLSGTDEHNLIHILHSLRKQGLIGFKINTRGRVAEPINITLTPSGERSLDGPRGN